MGVFRVLLYLQDQGIGKRDSHADNWGYHIAEGIWVLFVCLSTKPKAYQVSLNLQVRIQSTR